MIRKLYAQMERIFTVEKNERGRENKWPLHRPQISSHDDLR